MVRYAIFYAPDTTSALWRFGSGVLGYDAEKGECAAPRMPSGELDWAALTEEPQLYGFHATLKAPFELAEGKSEVDLTAAMHAYAANAAPVLLEALEVSLLGSFCALIPRGDVQLLNALGSDIVRHFETFRAPLSEAARKRRMNARLSERQIAYMDQYGYPYVHEEFRFHMTLTGALPAEQRRDACEALRYAYAQCAASSAAIDQIVLFRQAGQGERFRIAARAPFTLRRG
jgi:putative phosphonate metabolism protein